MKVLNLAARGRSRRGGPRFRLLRPGSRGEHVLQQRCGTEERAGRFYDSQFSDRLTPRMVEFIARMEMAFIATSNSVGECDCSLLTGPAGFINVGDHVIRIT